MDSLNGIVIGGLLGNGPSSLILGHFNLGLFGITVTVSPGGQGSAVLTGIPSRHEEEQERYLTVKVVLNKNQYTKVYKISNKQATVLIRVNEKVKTFMNKTKVLVDKFVVRPIKKVLKINIDNISNK